MNISRSKIAVMLFVIFLAAAGSFAFMRYNNLSNYSAYAGLKPEGQVNSVHLSPGAMPVRRAVKEPKKTNIRTVRNAAAVHVQPASGGDDRDTDADGVPDSLDQCPNTPPRIIVDVNGCFPDEDGDNVPNSRDKCPGTFRGTPVDASGCPIK